jgi:Zn-finger nucleic acid-binding protein
MNCEQCGAPLKVEKGQDFYHCEYCGAYHFPDPNLDGVALLDEVSSLCCPVCHKPLVLSVVKDIHIESCPVCRGNLIDQSRMLPLLREINPQDSIGEIKITPLERSEFKRDYACPSCKRKMAVYPYGGSGNVVIQGCQYCRLIWLDFGELARIIRTYLQQV